jgi:hypothetical protein
MNDCQRYSANQSYEIEHVSDPKGTPKNKGGRFSPPAPLLLSCPLTFIPSSNSKILSAEIRHFSQKIVGVATPLLHVATPIFPSRPPSKAVPTPTHSAVLISDQSPSISHVRPGFPNLCAPSYLRPLLIVDRHY